MKKGKSVPKSPGKRSVGRPRKSIEQNAPGKGDENITIGRGGYKAKNKGSRSKSRNRVSAGDPAEKAKWEKQREKVEIEKKKDEAREKERIDKESDELIRIADEQNQREIAEENQKKLEKEQKDREAVEKLEEEARQEKLRIDEEKRVLEKSREEEALLKEKEEALLKEKSREEEETRKEEARLKETARIEKEKKEAEDIKLMELLRNLSDRERLNLLNLGCVNPLQPATGVAQETVTKDIKASINNNIKSNNINNNINNININSSTNTPKSPTAQGFKTMGNSPRLTNSAGSNSTPGESLLSPKLSSPKGKVKKKDLLLPNDPEEARQNNNISPKSSRGGSEHLLDSPPPRQDPPPPGAIKGGQPNILLRKFNANSKLSGDEKGKIVQKNGKNGENVNPFEEVYPTLRKSILKTKGTEWDLFQAEETLSPEEFIAWKMMHDKITAKSGDQAKKKKTNFSPSTEFKKKPTPSASSTHNATKYFGLKDTVKQRLEYRRKRIRSNLIR